MNEAMAPMPPSVLEEAAELTSKERREQYGPAWTNFARIADLWTGYLSGRSISKQAPINMDDVCMMMTLLKIARHADSPTMKRDNVVDSIGYLSLTEQIRRELYQTNLKDGDKL